MNDESRRQNANLCSSILFSSKVVKLLLTEDCHALSRFSRRIRKLSIMLSSNRGLFEQVSGVRTDVAVTVSSKGKGGFT
jgi:hypothetical protein